MNLQEAIDHLKLGKNVCRQGWSLEDGYLHLMPGMDHIWKIVIKPSANAGNYIFSLEDLLADDWKEFELIEESSQAA